MNAAHETDNKQSTKGGPLPGLLRPPIIFLAAILLGVGLNRAGPLPFLSSTIRLLVRSSLFAPYFSSCFRFENFAALARL